MTEHETLVVEAMKRYGGGFVKALAMCFRRADLHNLKRLREAFPDYWTQYARLIEGGD